MLEATPETLIFSTSSKFLFSWQFLFSFGCYFDYISERNYEIVAGVVSCQKT